MKRLLSATLGLVLAVCLLAGISWAGEKTLMMATTTSTDNTGLLDYLAPEFKKATGIELKWTATGTGKGPEIRRELRCRHPNGSCAACREEIRTSGLWCRSS